jgi:hypothetical protein
MSESYLKLRSEKVVDKCAESIPPPMSLHPPPTANPNLNLTGITPTNPNGHTWRLSRHGPWSDAYASLARFVVFELRRTFLQENVPPSAEEHAHFQPHAPHPLKTVHLSRSTSMSPCGYVEKNPNGCGAY